MSEQHEESNPSSSGLPPVPDLAQSVELVRRIQGGDRQALDELIGRYYERVYRIARVRMGARLRNWMDSGDIVQNTFLVAFAKLGELEVRDHASIIRFLSTVLENQVRGAADYIHAAKRDDARSVPIFERSDRRPALAEELVAREPQPIDEVGTGELEEIYDACVNALKSEHREVVLLREYEEASWGEIAERLQRTEHAAQELYRRAQIKLAVCLRSKVRL